MWNPPSRQRQHDTVSVIRRGRGRRLVFYLTLIVYLAGVLLSATSWDFLLRSSNETSELRNLEQTYTTLAENEEWMAINIDKTIQRRKNRDTRGGSTDYALIRFDAGLVR